MAHLNASLWGRNRRTPLSENAKRALETAQIGKSFF